MKSIILQKHDNMMIRREGCRIADSPDYTISHNMALVGHMKMIFLLGFTLLLSGCADYPTKNALRGIALTNDPATAGLEQGYNKYVRRTFLEDGTEIGIISLKDGSSSKYWFRSHHLVDDAGGTWFFMSDGQEMYMAGWFCCEVQLPECQIESLDALREFIRKHHGIGP